MSDSKMKTVRASSVRNSSFVAKDYRDTQIEIGDAQREFEKTFQVEGRGSRPSEFSGRGRTYAKDAEIDYLSRYVSPDTPVLTALGILHSELVPNQRDDSAHPAWIMLRSRLGVFENPESTIADCDTESIANLVRTLEENVAN